MTGTTVQGNRALTALAALFVLFCTFGIAAVASESWGEIVVSAQDVITHE